MLNIVMNSIKNHFAKDRATGQLYGVEHSLYELKSGMLAVGGQYLKGQYIAITGSVLNNGAYKVENFENGIIGLIPSASDIPEWIKPTGAGTAYNTGDIVRHKGIKWICLQDMNIIEPGWAGTTGEWWDVYAAQEIQNPTFDESFNGTIYKLIIPYDFIQLVTKIEAFTNSNAGEQSNITSASFGIQSVSYGVNENGVKASWNNVFRAELNRYRRMTDDIII